MQQTIFGEKSPDFISPANIPLKHTTGYKDYHAEQKVQAKVGQDIDELKKKQAEEKIKEEESARLYRAKEQEFNAYFKEGSTQVILHNGIFYFWGDVSHCGKDNIFHNAKEIRKRMVLRGASYGHMNCNDLPTFDRSSFRSDRFTSFWEQEEHERKTIYKDDLYCFKGDEICLVDKIYEKEQEKRY